MGGKTRKKPLTFGDLISGWDRLKVGNEIWEVTRRLMPDHRTKEFGMVITAYGEKRILKGVNKGGTRVTITVDYIDKEEKNDGNETKKSTKKP